MGRAPHLQKTWKGGRAQYSFTPVGTGVDCGSRRIGVSWVECPDLPRVPAVGYAQAKFGMSVAPGGASWGCASPSPQLGIQAAPARDEAAPDRDEAKYLSFFQEALGFAVFPHERCA